MLLSEMESKEPVVKREPSQKEKLAAWKQRKQRSQAPVPGPNRRSDSAGKKRDLQSRPQPQAKPRSPKSAPASRRPLPVRVAAQKGTDIRGAKKTSLRDGSRGEKAGKEKVRDLNECMSVLDALTKARYLRVVSSQQWEKENKNLVNRCVEEATLVERKREALHEKKIRLEHIRYRRAVLARNNALKEFNFPQALEVSNNMLEACSTVLQQSSNRLYLKGATKHVSAQIGMSIRDDL